MGIVLRAIVMRKSFHCGFLGLCSRCKPVQGCFVARIIIVALRGASFGSEGARPHLLRAALLIGAAAVFKAVILTHQMLRQTSVNMRLVLLERVKALPNANLVMSCSSSRAHLKHGG